MPNKTLKLGTIAISAALLLGCGGGGSNTSALDSGDGVLSGLVVPALNDSSAARFLWKAAFGPTETSIAQVRQLGFQGWVTAQLATPSSAYSTHSLHPLGFPIYRAGADTNNPIRLYCDSTDGLTQFAGNNQLNRCLDWLRGEASPAAVFFKSAVHDPDQLRLRTAWALSQILVVSTNSSQKSGYGMRLYQQMLRDNAFGNFRDILVKITKNPYMGMWLNMALSHKDGPNQNYARELLQLFTMGIYRMNDNGTYALDANGKRIENYTENDVQEFSRALSGWTYSPSTSGTTTYNFKNPNYNVDMIPRNTWHDVGTKTLLALNGVPQTLQANRTHEQDLQSVIDNVFNHPSTPPYIVKQLIQFMVTSNPTTAYVNRVVNVFKNDGTGTRGNMAAVVKAIVLDQEALSPPTQAGKLQEPAIVLPGIVRSIGGSTDGMALVDIASQANQKPFFAPSVFNYYPFDAGIPLPGSNLKAPQFGLFSINSTVGYMGGLKTLLEAGGAAVSDSAPVAYQTGTQITWPSAWVTGMTTNTANSRLGVLKAMNVRMAGSALSTAELTVIANYVAGLTSQTVPERLGTAAFLLVSTPQFMSQR